MADNKQSFVAYCEWTETFNKLTDEQAGVLVKHIFAYVNDQNPEPKDFIIDLAFTPIKQQLKRDLKKYESIVERNKINGSKGGRPKKEETQKTHSVNSVNLGNPKKPKKADNDNVDDNVDVDDTDNGNEKKKNKGRFTPPTPTQVSFYAKEWKGIETDGEKFCDFYESKGWMVGKNKMKSWQAAVRNWYKEEATKKEVEQERQKHKYVEPNLLPPIVD